MVQAAVVRGEGGGGVLCARTWAGHLRGLHCTPAQRRYVQWVAGVKQREILHVEAMHCCDNFLCDKACGGSMASKRLHSTAEIGKSS